ncbi:MAG TPA: NAD(P)-dependent oxidoreductase [Firmicutes bacterium]|nr:NAD(P)-dependent oxidoreductase [Bacillota bacterium]
MRYAVITGASSGIGEAFAYELAARGYHLILVARRSDALAAIKSKIQQLHDVEVELGIFDLSNSHDVYALYETYKSYPVEVLINNAGYGLFGQFHEIELDQELNMMQLNMTTVHSLTKLWLRDFVSRDSGYILNVASTAAFSAGPLMASYYASKAYVLSLTEGIAEELAQANSQVVVSAFCPGPVATNFQKRAAIGQVGTLPTPDVVAREAVAELFKRKPIIINGSKNKMLIFFNRFIPRKLARVLVYKNQLKKNG